MSISRQFIFRRSGTSAAARFGITPDGAASWSNTGTNTRLLDADSSGVSLAIAASESVGKFLTLESARATDSTKSIAALVPVVAQNVTVAFTIVGQIDATGQDAAALDVSINASNGTISGNSLNSEFVELLGDADTVTDVADQTAGGDLGLSDSDLVALLRDPSTVFYLSPENGALTAFGALLDQIVLTVTFDYPTYLDVPLVHGDAALANKIQQALAGEIKMNAHVVGDSNDDPYAGNGGYSQPARNAALLPHQRGHGHFLRAVGGTKAGLVAGGVWTNRLPISHIVDSNGQSGVNGSDYLGHLSIYTGLTTAAKTKLKASLPPGWIEGSSNGVSPWVCPKYEAGTGSVGLASMLQAWGDHYPPEFGVCIGRGTQAWKIDETGTAFYGIFLSCADTGFVDEAKIVVTGTDTLFPIGGIPASSRTIYTTGSGGIPALQLAQAPLMSSDDANGNPTVKAVKITPLSWKDTGGTVRRAIRTHIAGDGGKIICLWHEYRYENAKGFAFIPCDTMSGQTASGAVTDFAYCGSVLRMIRDFEPDAETILFITLGVNDCYNLNKTADQWIADIIALVADRREKYQDPEMGVVISKFPFRDNSSTSGSVHANDAQYDQYEAAAQAAIDDGRLTHTILLNTRLWMHAQGWNRANENIFDIKTASTGMLARDGYKPWAAGDTYASRLIGAAGAPVPIEALSSTLQTTSTHPVYGGNARYTWGGARRIFLSSNQSGGSCLPDDPHPSAHGFIWLRNGEVALLAMTSRLIGGSGVRGGSNSRKFIVRR